MADQASDIQKILALAKEEYGKGDYEKAAPLYKQYLTALDANDDTKGTGGREVHSLVFCYIKLERWGDAEVAAKDILQAYEAREKAEEGTDLSNTQALEQQQLGMRVMLIQALERQNKNSEARDQAKTAIAEAESLKEPERSSWISSVKEKAGKFL